VNGVVVQFDNDRGYGFIRSPGLKEDVFVHIKAVAGGQEIRVGQRVEFDTKETPKGLSAINVVPGKQQASPASRFGWPAAGGVAALSALVMAGGVPWLVAYLIGVNTTTFLFYGYDKAIAGSRRLRVPENVLHGLALCGGSLGALLGQKVFRHKTRKPWFQVMYWAIVALQAGLLLQF
jgi:uncharacterized membrane protein YsdA (DUF1294 family)/cold shock CspA family protein